jgi:glutamine synthetase
VLAGPLPVTLGEALEELTWSPVVRAALGQPVYERFIAEKEREWAAERRRLATRE